MISLNSSLVYLMVKSKKSYIQLVIIGNGTFVLDVLLLSTEDTSLYFFFIPTIRENIYYTEDQAFSSSCDLAPPPPPLPSVSSADDTQED